MSANFIERYGDCFLARVLTVGNTYTVRPWPNPRWPDTLAGVIPLCDPPDRPEANTIVRVFFEGNQWYLDCTPVIGGGGGGGGGDIPVINDGRLRIQVEMTGAGQQFLIPLAGNIDGPIGEMPTTPAWAWDINWGDGNTASVSSVGINSDVGIPHTYANAGRYVITIGPSGGNFTQGWLSAFGFGNTTSSTNAYAQANRNRIITCASQITPQMFAISTGFNEQMEQVPQGQLPQFWWIYLILNQTQFPHNNGYRNVCHGWFRNCQNAGFYMHPNFGFSSAWNTIANLTVGRNFLSRTFQGCNSAAFSMNSTFNPPQNIITCGGNFLFNTFQGCSGAQFTMNNVFNVPAARPPFLRLIGSYSGHSGFGGMDNLTGFEYVWHRHIENYCNNTFGECTGDAFMVNSIFRLRNPLRSDAPGSIWNNFPISTWPLPPESVLPWIGVVNRLELWTEGGSENDVSWWWLHRDATNVLPQQINMYDRTLAATAGKNYPRQTRRIDSIIPAAMPTWMLPTEPARLATFRIVDETRGMQRWADWGTTNNAWK